MEKEPENEAFKRHDAAFHCNLFCADPHYVKSPIFVQKVDFDTVCDPATLTGKNEMLNEQKINSWWEMNEFSKGNNLVVDYWNIGSHFQKFH